MQPYWRYLIDYSCAYPTFPAFPIHQTRQQIPSIGAKYACAPTLRDSPFANVPVKTILPPAPPPLILELESFIARCEMRMFADLQQILCLSIHWRLPKCFSYLPYVMASPTFFFFFVCEYMRYLYPLGEVSIPLFDGNGLFDWPHILSWALPPLFR